MIPLLKDVTLAQNLEFNGAFRYTDYSTSGGVKTWKLGLSWEPADDLRVRATRSNDIRAPSLFELFAGRSGGTTGFTDLHTGVAGFTANSSQGNPNLVPEVAHTITVGGVWTPRQLPGFSVSVDYYDIKIEGAIANRTVAQLNQDCEASNGTAPSCALISRPLPFSAARSPPCAPSPGISSGTSGM